MKLPLIAFGLVQGAVKVSWDDGVPRQIQLSEYLYAPIGFLTEFEVEHDLPDGLEQAKKMTAPFGLEPSYVCMGIRGQDAVHRGVMVTIGVMFDDVQDAKKIPGFCHIGMFSGVYDCSDEALARATTILRTKE